ncbi:hypothetical protein HXA35_04250 [Bacillus sp. A301a_S52]|nr:hypothetical protein [Bacillus sp. A301a_S52]
MDRFSHIALAKKLLETAGERTELAYMSILPLVDGEPSFLHRLHSHPLVKGPVVVDCAKVVFGTIEGHVPPLNTDTFELRRFEQEKQQFIDAFNEAIGTDKEMAIDDGYGALLSVISHSYFDTYNNAVQAFAPYESYCAGQYEMWSKVDYFNYRIKWYQETAPSVRNKVVSEKFWDNYSFTAEELVKGMVNRVASFTQPRVSEETIKRVEHDLGVSYLPYNKKVEEFYLNLEETLEKHLIESVNETENIVVQL